MNLTRQLCEFLVRMKPEDISPENMMDIRYKTLDWLGCTIAAQSCPSTEYVGAMIDAAGGNPQATAVGRGYTSAQNAAFYNGFISHTLEYDDTNKIAITHPGAPVIAAALAVAEAGNASFETYALGVAAGYEAMIRLGGAANPEHYAYWHTTGTCGTFAAAAAAAKIMGLNGEQMERAMGIASTMASGLVYVFGTEAKLVTVGNAARNGIAAAELARSGVSAPQDGFAGKKAYAQSANGSPDLQFMVPQPGDALLLEDAYYKMHAACGHTHSALDALQALIADHGLTAQQVTDVQIRVYQTAFELCSRYETVTETKAKFSMPYCVSVMLLYGKCTLTEFAPELLHSESIREYAQRIHIQEDPNYTAAYPKLRTETVTLTCADGRVLSKTVDLPVGKPPYPMLDTKFYALAEMAVTHSQAQAVREAVLSLEAGTPMRTLHDCICEF